MNNDKRDGMIVEIHAVVHSLKDVIDRHDKTLYGNGQPGLCKRLNDLESKIMLSSKWAIGIVATMSTVFGGLITIAASAFVKKLIG